ncbi:MAG: hypothetical protein IPL49_06645 [Saprospirales bacterium]|nr:hypothetical protein [Saprospirales bacterium]MBK8490571.1 hypothetical protein [Saprospirales bacterium]
MEHIIRIGIPENCWNITLESDLIQALKDQSRLPEFQVFGAGQLHPMLRRGDLDLVAFPLHLTPVAPPAGIAHAALLAREEPVSTLLIHPGAQDTTLFQLKTGARVQVTHPGQEVQLNGFRPDLQVVLSGEGNPESRVEALREGRVDALVFDPFESRYFQAFLEDIVQVSLNPREFCPPPGAGAIVLQTSADDLSLRRLLKTLHHLEDAARTNVERKLLRLFGGDLQLPLGAFCEQDTMGNYHLWASFAAGAGQSVRRERLSSSTAFELAEQVFSAFQ